MVSTPRRSLFTGSIFTKVESKGMHAPNRVIAIYTAY